jgi:hypothetical protein
MLSLSVIAIIMKDQREDYLVANLKYMLEISNGRQDTTHL